MLDEQAAREKALEYVEDGRAVLECTGISNGKIPFYSFEGTLSDSRRAELAVCVQGGALLYMRTDGGAKANGDGSSEAPDEAELRSLEKAGEEWLERHGCSKMQASYAQFYGDRVGISFASVEQGEFGMDTAAELLFKDNGLDEIIGKLRGGSSKSVQRVIFYSDLIKLLIERGSENIIGYDAQNYLFCHGERELSGELMSAERAAERLSKNLEIESTALALIPLADQSERLCYEFKGNFAGGCYIVYLDAMSGDEVQIFRLIEDGNGSITV